MDLDLFSDGVGVVVVVIVVVEHSNHVHHLTNN